MVVSVLNNKSEYEKALAENSLMFIDCFATWCGPCKSIAPVIETYSSKYTSIKFFKLDVDQVSDVAQELGIRAMPTFILFKDGEKVSEVIGANPQAIETAVRALSGPAQEGTKA